MVTCRMDVTRVTWSVAHLNWFRSRAWFGWILRKGRPKQGDTGGEHDAVHQEPEDVGLKMQHETFGDEGAKHQGRARNQPFQRDIRRQRTEAFEGDRFAEIESERTCGFGGEEGALGQSVKQKQR